MSDKILLGEILTKKGLISSLQLQRALKRQKQTKDFLGSVLINEGYISETDLLGALSEQFNIPLVDIDSIDIDWELACKFSKTLILEHRCLPVSQTDDRLTLAINNPLDVWAISEIEKKVPGCRVEIVLVKSADMDRMIEYYKNFRKTRLKRLF